MKKFFSIFLLMALAFTLMLVGTTKSVNRRHSTYR